MIEIRNLHAGYVHTPLFKDFNLHVDKKEFWTVAGPSGTGKTTLLYILSGLLKPESGIITIDTSPVSRPRPETGFVFQEHGLLPWCNVLDNILLGPRIRKFYGPDGKHAPLKNQAGLKEARERAGYWMDRLEILDQGGKYIHQLSGGQKQRAAIARSLILEPDLLLLDEPFSSLDISIREKLQELLLELAREAELTCILVTHSVEEAVFLGRKILILDNPPVSQPVVVDNPGSGRAGFRKDPGYKKQCQKVRAMLEKNNE